MSHEVRSIEDLDKAIRRQEEAAGKHFAVVVCPECNGKNGGMVHLNTTSGGRWEHRRCTFCVGMGEVSSLRAERYRLGQAMAADRKARKVSLREEAARLGMTPQELSRREHGRD